MNDRVLGISARSLSGDATRVTLRVCKPGLLRTLKSAEQSAS